MPNTKTQEPEYLRGMSPADRAILKGIEKKIKRILRDSPIIAKLADDPDRLDLLIRQMEDGMHL